MNPRITALTKPTVVALAVMMLGLSGVMGSTAVAQSSKVNTVTAHLHAVVDMSTARPECSLASTLPDCNHISYSGATGEYSGGLVGTLSFSGYGYIRNDGKLAIQEDEDIFTGTVKGCGTGAFTYSASGVFDVDPANGGLVGDEVLKVVRGSGSGGLKGLRGGATGTFVVNQDGSIDADYDWAVTCGNQRASDAQ